MKLLASLKPIHALVGLMLLPAFSASAQTVLNGSFEDQSGMTFVTDFRGDFYDGASPGWVWTADAANPTANGVNHIHRDFTGSPISVTGDYFLEAGNANALGVLSQDISGFTPGTGYILSFDWGNREDTDPNRYAYNFSVSIGGETFSRSGPTGGGVINFTTEELLFKASSTVETLSITFADPGDGLNSATIGALDNFSLAAAPVPEPGTAAFLGIAGAALFLRRRRRG